MNPKEECEILMSELLPVGEHFLKKSKEFYPFAAAMNIDGSINHLGYYDGDDKPDAKELIVNLKQLCKQLAENNEIKASGIVWNASTQREGKDEDAIIVSLEHKDNYSVQIAMPYKKGFLGKFQFGNLIALAGENDVF